MSDKNEVEIVECECEHCKEKRLYHEHLKKLERHIVSYIV